MNNIVYQTGLSCEKSTIQLEEEEQARQEREYLDEWIFSDPIDCDEDWCDETNELTLDDELEYDLICEQHWADRLERLAEEQEY